MSSVTSSSSNQNGSLPHDIFTYTHKRFYDFIRQAYGDDLAELFTFQSIRSGTHLLQTSKDDILSVFQQQSTELDALKKLCCFPIDGKKHEVKLGVKLAIDNLMRKLTCKQEEEKKSKRRTSKRQLLSSDNGQKAAPIDQIQTQATSTTSTDLSLGSTSSSTPIIVSSASMITHNQTFSSPSSSDSNSEAKQTQFQSPVKSKQLTEVDHRIDLQQRITKWWNKENSDSNLSLTENTDYFLKLTKLAGQKYTVVLSCKCGTRFNLPLLVTGLFKLSSFYRHVKDAQCLKKRKMVNSFNFYHNMDVFVHYIRCRKNQTILVLTQI
jgi:hypothetical protein